MIYYCENCDKFFLEHDVRYVKPDVGIFCYDYNHEVEHYSEDQIVEELNEARR